MPKDEIQTEMTDARATCLQALEGSVDSLDKDITETRGMARLCIH